MSIYRTRRSCKVPRSPRNDSLLRTVLPLQHLTHVRPAVRVSNPIDTPLVNHNIPSQPGISIYQPRPTIYLYSTTSTDHLAVLNDQHQPSSCTQRPATTITDIYIHACKYDKINCHLLLSLPRLCSFILLLLFPFT